MSIPVRHYTMGHRKRCIVIGGSGAVGRRVCIELARQGAAVALTYLRNKDVAQRIQSEIEGVGAYRLDLTDVAAVENTLTAMADEIGGIDALVHAAAVGSTFDPARFDQLADVTVEGWNRMMAVNITSPFLACQALAARFGDEGGNVVLIGAIDGVKSVPSPVPYATSKGALRAMVSSLAKELGQRSIRVNLVATGVLESGSSRTLPGTLRAEYLKHCGLQRVGAIDEVANVVSFFALSNSYVTGQAVAVDGGL